ncbi:hypothetical protein [uncultured Planktosalinus sp.]|uniref:hypothetical protein n=1 Tax=uncultured Planktosalinus sp. TaxID=1810935 RepID=UPI0030DAD1D0
MKIFLVSLLFLFLYGTMHSQVGINTTTPSPASVLDVNSSSDGTNFGGFMPPRVSPAERDLIPVTASDEGLMVYVINPPNNQLQLWDGTSWQIVFPQQIFIDTIIASWDMEGLANYGPSPFTPGNSSSSVVVNGLERGTGLNTSGTAAGDAWGASEWYSAAPTETQSSAIANNKYVTFTITPNTGNNISISSIEPYNIRRSGTGPINGIWQYSIDGVNFIDIGTVINWGVTTSGAGNPQQAINLSGVNDLQNINSSTTITFRVVCWGATGTGGTWYFNDFGAGDDLIIRGNTN